MSSSIESLIVSLFESLNDKDDNVREAVLSSLHTIGINEPGVFLNAGHLFLATRHAKLSNTHRSSLLNSMKKVCAETVQIISDNLAALIINLAIQELIFNKV
uniref:MROH2B-like N-terminal HEAT-repeats domain-containing protein n=1 Tax=Romanomermis culicivorax TaxID=13658 RepID=A0A915IX29_ROMCU